MRRWRKAGFSCASTAPNEAMRLTTTPLPPTFASSGRHPRKPASLRWPQPAERPRRRLQASDVGCGGGAVLHAEFEVDVLEMFADRPGL